MILESVRGRRAALARLWDKTGLPAVMLVALITTVAWRLLGWDWMTPIVAASVSAAGVLVVFDDVFNDRVPGAVPDRLRRTWRWVWRNATLIDYPVAAVAGIVAGRWFGWPWLIALGVMYGLAAVAEFAVLVIVRRTVADRGLRRRARAVGSRFVSLWLDVCATLGLIALLIQYPHDHGASVLHWLIPMYAVAAVADYRLVRRHVRAGLRLP